MDRNRLLLAFVLMMIVAIAPSIIWPSKKPAGRPVGPTAGDTTKAAQGDTGNVIAPRPSGRPAVAESDTGRVVLVTSPLYRLGFSTKGGRLVSTELLQYQSFAPGDSVRPVQLVPQGDAFLRHRLVLPSGDTVSLDNWDFQPTPDAPGVVVSAGQTANPLRFDAERAGSHVTLALDEGQPTFGGAIAIGGPRTGRAASRATVLITMPVQPAGTFRYSVYTGPLDYRQLGRMGHGLDDANPYGGIFRPIIRPVSLFVTSILLWMHERLDLAYGWALILFGIVVRLLLWPLNQKAMESGIRMQAVAPLLKETQEKYAKDPERLQREMLRVYKEYKVNPFGGCLPMLLPWPVLLALFFVFANTIVFRGVPFLWLPDLSRPDPFRIIPILLGLSMFGLSKVGQIGVPPNPQTKMMVYFMPIFMTVLFLNFASGLNLYYAAQNIFSIPQQYLIAKRRLREAPVAGARPPVPAKT